MQTTAELSVWAQRWRVAIEASMAELGAIRDELQRMGYNTMAHQVQRAMMPCYDTLEGIEAASPAQPEQPAQRRQGRGVLQTWQ